MWFASASWVYYWCVNAINCTGQNASKYLLLALGEADANMYLCSNELRPSEYNLSPVHLRIRFVKTFLFTMCKLVFVKSLCFSFLPQFIQFLRRQNDVSCSC